MVASKGLDWYLLGVLVASTGTWWPPRGRGGLHGVVVVSKGVDRRLAGVLVGLHGDVVVSMEEFGISQGLWWVSMGTFWSPWVW